MSKEKIRLVEELHAPARHNFPRRRVIVRGYDDLWQADIVDMQPHAKINRGQRYILTIIDVFSKYAWGLPLKTKGGNDVANAFKIVLQDGRQPKNLQTDEGKEFYNTNFHKVIDKYGINHYSTYSVMKASVVERFNRTLKNDMWKQFTLNGSYRWVDLLPKLLNDYNRRRHRTIGMRPIDVTPKNSKHLLNTVYSKIKILGPAKFKIGDKVRVSKYKSTFAKGYTPNWSYEILEVDKVQRTNPVTYRLKDSFGNIITGGFYEHELHSVRDPDIYLVEKILRKKGKKVYVKWWGMDAAHNSWINKNNVL